MFEDREEKATQLRKKVGNSPLKAIREKCLDCSCGSWKEVKTCEIIDCPLHGFRFGVRPKTAQKQGRG